ncbi:MAG: hypothetical protein AAF628_34000 [Planctomycetota bacterium]
MSHHPWFHLVHGAAHEAQRGNSKVAGVMFIIIGFFTAPMLIGIPIMLLGLWKLCR